jgi:geranylgeranyl pyrophosphate synthase
LDYRRKFFGKLGTWFIIGEDMLDVGSSPESMDMG